ncbi:unnamed protein product, partial [Allacma fusca]
MNGIYRQYSRDQNTNSLRNAVSLFSLLGSKIAALIFHLNIFFFENESFIFTNQMFQLRTLYNLRSDFPAAKIFVKIYILRALQSLVLSILKPNKMQFWYSVLDEKMKTKWFYSIHCVFNVQATLMQFGILFLIVNSLSYTTTLGGLLESGNISRMQGQKLFSYRCGKSTGTITRCE